MPRRRTTVDDYERRILRVQQLLASRLDEPIAPAELARAASFSLHHFHRIFRAQLGESVMQHVRRLRLERAARRLRAAEDGRLIDVALEAGYDSHEAFTRAFAERFGVTPSEFRAQPSARVTAWQRTARAAAAVPVDVRTTPALRVAFMRSRGSYAAVGAMWARMYAWLRARGLGGGLYGICPDDPEVTDEALLRFDACVVVPDDFAPDGDEAIGITEIPAGTYAIGLHVGPYERLAETYLDVIGRWFPTSGHELAPEAVIEHYLDDPSCTPVEALRTEVRVRIAD
jgi:AraC family transcriptional regulator